MSRGSWCCDAVFFAQKGLNDRTDIFSDSAKYHWLLERHSKISILCWGVAIDFLRFYYNRSSRSAQIVIVAKTSMQTSMVARGCLKTT